VDDREERAEGRGDLVAAVDEEELDGGGEGDAQTRGD
jgi:hypothetical protein